MPIQFHLDENVDGEIARGLRSRGIDVTTTADAGLGEATDEEHVAFALSQRRVIFTHDADFIRLAAPEQNIGASSTARSGRGKLRRFLPVSHSFMHAWNPKRCGAVWSTSEARKHLRCKG